MHINHSQPIFKKKASTHLLDYKIPVNLNDQVRIGFPIDSLKQFKLSGFLYVDHLAELKEQSLLYQEKCLLLDFKRDFLKALSFNDKVTYLDDFDEIEINESLSIDLYKTHLKSTILPVFDHFVAKKEKVLASFNQSIELFCTGQEQHFVLSYDDFSVRIYDVKSLVECLNQYFKSHLESTIQHVHDFIQKGEILNDLRNQYALLNTFFCDCDQENLIDLFNGIVDILPDLNLEFYKDEL